MRGSGIYGKGKLPPSPRCRYEGIRRHIWPGASRGLLQDADDRPLRELSLSHRTPLVFKRSLPFPLAEFFRGIPRKELELGDEPYGLPMVMDARAAGLDQAIPELRATADTIVAEIRRLLVGRAAAILVALDGGSGSGKSTLAALVAHELGAALVPCDDFYAAEISDAGWDARTPEARARDAIDWRRLRADALEPLLAGRPAKWRAFDFEAGALPNGAYAMRSDFIERAPSAVVVLEGATSTRPELADLIDLSILVDVPVAVRHKRLAAREAKAFLESWYAGARRRLSGRDAL